MDNDNIKKIVMQILEETQDDSVSPGRDLVWHPLRGVFSTWIYILGKSPLASVWLDVDDGLWHYSIPMYNQTGAELFKINAMANVSSLLAEDDSLG